MLYDNKVIKLAPCIQTGTVDSTESYLNFNKTVRKITPMKMPGKMKGRNSDEGVMNTMNKKVRVLRYTKTTGPGQEVTNCI